MRVWSLSRSLVPHIPRRCPSARASLLARGGSRREHRPSSDDLSSSRLGSGSFGVSRLVSPSLAVSRRLSASLGVSGHRRTRSLATRSCRRTYERSRRGLGKVQERSGDEIMSAHCRWSSSWDGMTSACPVLCARSCTSHAWGGGRVAPGHEGPAHSSRVRWGRVPASRRDRRASPSYSASRSAPADASAAPANTARQAAWRSGWLAVPLMVVRTGGRSKQV